METQEAAKPQQNNAHETYFYQVAATNQMEFRYGWTCAEKEAEPK